MIWCRVQCLGVSCVAGQPKVAPNMRQGHVVNNASKSRSPGRSLCVLCSSRRRGGSQRFLKMSMDGGFSMKGGSGTAERPVLSNVHCDDCVSKHHRNSVNGLHCCLVHLSRSRKQIVIASKVSERLLPVTRQPSGDDVPGPQPQQLRSRTKNSFTSIRKHIKRRLSSFANNHSPHHDNLQNLDFALHETRTISTHHALRRRRAHTPSHDRTYNHCRHSQPLYTA